RPRSARLFPYTTLFRSADAAALDQAFVMHRVEAVIHFAAFAYVGESVNHPARYYQNNLVNALALLDAVRRHKVGRFVFSSTCARSEEHTSELQSRFDLV